MEKSHVQLKNDFGSRKQGALLAFHFFRDQLFTLLLTEKLCRTGEKDNLSVNSPFSQTWTL